MLSEPYYNYKYNYNSLLVFQHITENISMFVFYCRMSSDLPYSTDHKEQNFIVFESALLQLFTICIACYNPSSSAVVQAEIGTMIVVQQTYKLCGHKWHWTSQGKIGNIPACNILLSSAILFTGALPSKTLCVLKVMGVAAIN